MIARVMPRSMDGGTWLHVFVDEREVLRREVPSEVTDDEALRALGFRAVLGWAAAPAGSGATLEAELRVPLLMSHEQRCGEVVFPHVAACYCERVRGHRDEFHVCACGGAWLGRHPDVEVLVPARGLRAR